MAGERGGGSSLCWWWVPRPRRGWQRYLRNSVRRLALGKGTAPLAVGIPVGGALAAGDQSHNHQQGQRPIAITPRYLVAVSR